MTLHSLVLFALLQSAAPEAAERRSAAIDTDRAAETIRIDRKMGDPAEARDGRSEDHDQADTKALKDLAPDEPTRLVPLTKKTVREELGGRRGGAALKEELESRQWKPSEKWMATEGKKYGRLLIVSDIHPGSGLDPLTGKVSPSEHFMPDRQEIDFRHMLESEWGAGKQDGQVRSLVLNGDCFEFMLQTEAPDGEKFEGSKDAYGPNNTARNVITKLQANHEGHPGLFATFAQHLVEGNRLVIVPGNHDRQLQHPAVRAALRMLLKGDVAGALERDPSFHPELSGDARHTQAMHEAKHVVEDRVELHPHYLMLGDVFVQHGHENDPENSFRTLLGDFYSEPKRDTPIEAAFGDYFVKAVFNTVEAKVPWGASGKADKLEVAFDALKPDKGRTVTASKLVRAMGYVATRGGHGDEAEETAIEQKQRSDIERLVKEYGMTEKFNELRQGETQLTDADVVTLMLEYQRHQAEPVLGLFKKNSGLFSRAFAALGHLPSMVKHLSSDEHAAREEASNAFLFGTFKIKTHATGHDHDFRLQRYLVGEKGKERLGEMLDDATWIDEVPNASSRDEMAHPTEMRGVITVDFKADGSHSQLSHWDPERRELAPVAVLEDVGEALGKD